MAEVKIDQIRISDTFSNIHSAIAFITRNDRLADRTIDEAALAAAKVIFDAKKNMIENASSRRSHQKAHPDSLS